MDLLQNPFYILGASPRDSRKRIVELAEERGIHAGEHNVTQARSDLTNPRKRLSAEMAWLPGVGPRRAADLLSKLQRLGPELLQLDNLAPVARANFLAAGVARLPNYTAEAVVPWIMELAWVSEATNAEEVTALINDERVVAEFPPVTDLSAVEAELQERRRHFGQTLSAVLKRLPESERTGAITVITAWATDDGKRAALLLVDDVVDAFEVEMQAQLDAGVEKIGAIVDNVKADAEAGQPYAVVAKDIEELSRTVRDWDVIAQPIQLSTRGRGLEHVASKQVAAIVRQLAVYLYNTHDRVTLAKKLTKLLQEVFAEVVDVAERVAEDASFLDGVTEQRRLERLFGPLVKLCQTARQNAEATPLLADTEAKRVLDDGGALLAKLRSERLPPEAISEKHDEVALTAMSCVIDYANRSEHWQRCVMLLESALLLAVGAEAKGQINSNLAIARKNALLFSKLTPIDSPPSLSTINGIGFKLYGATDFEPETKSHLATYYFVFFFIPIFPICRYRVIPDDGGYRFLGKAPLRQSDKLHLGAAVAALAFFVLLMASEGKSGTGDQSTASVTRERTSSPSPSSFSSFTGSMLAREIEEGKSRASRLESEISELDRQLEQRRNAAGAAQIVGNEVAYDLEVSVHNRVLLQRNSRYDEYSRLVDEINAKVERYNALNGSSR